MSIDKLESCNFDGNEVCAVDYEGRECEGADACINLAIDNPQQITTESFEGLPVEALRYIQRLKSELSSAKKVSVCAWYMLVIFMLPYLVS